MPSRRVALCPAGGGYAFGVGDDAPPQNTTDAEFLDVEEEEGPADE